MNKFNKTSKFEVNCDECKSYISQPSEKQVWSVLWKADSATHLWILSDSFNCCRKAITLGILNSQETEVTLTGKC